MVVLNNKYRFSCCSLHAYARCQMANGVIPCLTHVALQVDQGVGGLPTGWRPHWEPRGYIPKGNCCITCWLSLDRFDSVFQVIRWHIAGASGHGWTRRFPLGCQCGMGLDLDSAQCTVLLLRILRCSVQCRLCWLVAVWVVVAEGLRIGPDSQCCPSSLGAVGGRAIIMVNIS